MRERSAPSIRIRWGLGLFLLLLIYDGALRKWLVPGAEQILFIAKDALLLALLLYVALGHRRKGPAVMQPTVRLLFMLYAVWVVLEVANLALPNLLVGLWGLKSHLLYASLILLLPLAFQRLDDVLQLLVKIYPWVVIPVCVLAFAQLAAPADSFINQQVRGGIEGIAYFGDAGLVRVTGTFSYITGMAVFVQVTTLLGAALFLGGARSRLFLVGLGFALAAVPATGSRGVVAVVMVGTVILLLSALVSRLIGLRTALRMGVVLAILMTISLFAQDTAWEAFAQRAESSRGDENRAFTAITNAFSHFDTAGFLGFGSGAANAGAAALANGVPPFSWFPAGTTFEEESGRLMLELGLLGWGLSMFMRLALLFWAGTLAMKGRTRTVRVAAVLALPIMALAVQQGTGVFAPPFLAVYYWFCVALLAMAEYEHRLALSGRVKMLADQWQKVRAR